MGKTCKVSIEGKIIEESTKAINENYIMCLNSLYRDYASGDTYEEHYCVFSIKATSYDDAKNKLFHGLQEEGIKNSKDYSTVTEKQALSMINSKDDWNLRVYKNNFDGELLEIQHDR